MTAFVPAESRRGGPPRPPGAESRPTTHATVSAEKGRLAGCCAVPTPRTGRPHVRAWVGDGTNNQFLAVELSIEAAQALGQALLSAADTLEPDESDFEPAQLRLPAVEDPHAET